MESIFQTYKHGNFTFTCKRKIIKFVPAPLLVGIELNPGPRGSKHLSEPQRWRIVFLNEENGLNETQIARKMKITRDTVYDTLQRYAETGTVHDRPGRGRKRKLTEKEEKKIVKRAQKVGARQAAREYSSRKGKKLNEITVRRVMKKYHFFYLKRKKIQKLKQRDKDKRMEFAEEMIDYNWKLVLFTDEKSFWLGSSPDKAWQTLDKRIEDETEKWTPKLHVWGGIGYYFKSELYFFEQNMDGKLYQQILRKRLPPTPFIDCPRRLKKKWVFLQDNDPKHKSKKSMELVQELTENRFIKHPPYSPDFNLWRTSGLIWIRRFVSLKLRQSED